MDKPATAHPGPSLARALVWLRRDLRAHDHAALSHALRSARQVWCVFVFDRDILDPLPRADRRVEFIRASLVDLDQQLASLHEGSGVIVRHGHAVAEVARLAATLQVQAVYASHDDEPTALARDAQARGRLADIGVALHLGKDHVIFERGEVLTQGGTPFSVFTPYKNAWLKKLEPGHLREHPVATLAAGLAPVPSEMRGVPSLAELGFEPTNLASLKWPLGATGGAALLQDFLGRIERYHETRDFPALKGPSYLSTHLRFGTVSIRELARHAHQRMAHGSRGAEVWLAELIWRDFYHQILHHHPHVVGHAFKPAYERIKWEHGKHAQALFAAWC